MYLLWMESIHFFLLQVQMERRNSNQSSKWLGILAASMRKIKPGDVMEARQRVYLPVSVAESKISNRFDTIPSGTLNPNADEIDYLRRLVMCKDSAIIVLNKPPETACQGKLAC
ncbi:hypothetical protein SAY86_006723 [Trapa natans]|uniref:Uncharacterized protein n=1 Tax=Trapa natans TaxID=22666 RepID=A0AAN7QX22_TRANT|nr:hypothetical protein SAY86_006723 [Trapa natans]